jgi:hypothetical protein
MFIEIEGGQYLNASQIFQISFDKSPRGASVLSFSFDGENPRRGDVANEKQLRRAQALVKKPGWVKLGDNSTYLNLNRCAYISISRVDTVGDVAKIFIAGKQMHFEKDQKVVCRIREALKIAGGDAPEDLEPKADCDATDNRQAGSGNNGQSQPALQI